MSRSCLGDSSRETLPSLLVSSIKLLVDFKFMSVCLIHYPSIFFLSIYIGASVKFQYVKDFTTRLKKKKKREEATALELAGNPLWLNGGFRGYPII